MAAGGEWGMSGGLPPLPQLAAWYPMLADCRDIRRWDSEGLSGAKIWQCRAAGGSWCLRRWPEGVPLPRIDWVHQVVRRVADAGCHRLAVPLRHCQGGSVAVVQDASFEVAPWLPGQADDAACPTAARRAAAMRALAEFHLASARLGDLTTCRVAPGLERRRQLGHLWASARLEALGEALRRAAGQPLLEEARQIVDLCERRLLARHWLRDGPAVPVAVQPCLRDIWQQHVLFVGDQVTGLVDYDALQIDSPATDVARLLGSLTSGDPPRWREGLEAYHAVRPVSPAEWELLHWLDEANTLLSGLQWCDWIFLQRRQFADLSAVRQRMRHFRTRLECAW